MNKFINVIQGVPTINTYRHPSTCFGELCDVLEAIGHRSFVSCSLDDSKDSLCDGEYLSSLSGISQDDVEAVYNAIIEHECGAVDNNFDEGYYS